MKLLVALLAASFALATTHAQQVIIYQPTPPITVVSPLTPAPAASSQTLLNQITGTITQRRFEHQVLTTNATLRATQPVIVNPPRR